MQVLPRSTLLVMLSVLGLSCAHGTGDSAASQHESLAQTPPAQPHEPHTPQGAKAFIDRVNQELEVLFKRSATAEWVRSTYITPDTENLAAWHAEEEMAYLSQVIPASMQFQGLDLAPDTRRMLGLLKLQATLPAPSDPAKRAELAQIVTRLEGMYGRATWCGEDGTGPCRDLQALEEIMAKRRDWGELLDAWRGWRTISPPMKTMYARQVELMNEGAREIGFHDVATLWKAGYEMSGAEFEQETDRLWNQVRPLYEELHCYVRAKLTGHYGADKVPASGPIPAHLLGNMWAQEWSKIFDLVVPYPSAARLDVDAALAQQGWDAIKMVETSERFFTSLGLAELPQSFWERSLLIKPRDRDVVCHASAWDVTSRGDLRIKMCIRPTEEDLTTIHHELGHIYYYVYYHDQPILYQAGAHDGFHEAIGDALVLSITPSYLRQLGLIDELPQGDAGLINTQLKSALDKVAFVPYGRMIDQWRWDVFSGKITPQQYNQHWWHLRNKFQGVATPVERTEEDFDPGAKFHIPGNTPYIRYFLARILQFQLYQGLCQAAGHTGPLHECSIYGSTAAGDRLRTLLDMGASRPWPDALEAATGQRTMDAGPLLAYYQPLHGWLKQQNQGRQCGW